MREILFRGKRLDNGEWVASGNLIRFNPEHGEDPVFIPGLNEKCTSVHDGFDNIIAFNEAAFYKVDPDTVGQFTGLTDKNGKKIFEGDIVSIQNDTPFEMTGHIAFYSGCFELHDPTCDMYECLWYEAKDMEVLGNIHDNPELLEGGDSDGF